MEENKKKRLNRKEYSSNYKITYITSDASKKIVI